MSASESSTIKTTRPLAPVARLASHWEFFSRMKALLTIQGTNRTVVRRGNGWEPEASVRERRDGRRIGH